MSEILLIDDSPTQLRVREAVLTQAGFSVATADTAAGALEFLRAPENKQRVKVIVTDHVMPGASGADFVRELRRLQPAVPVIVVSGLAEAEEEYTGLNVSFLNKPCPPEELIDTVSRALRDGH
jgi:DNA-binding NtrC family response regulator